MPSRLLRLGVVASVILVAPRAFAASAPYDPRGRPVTEIYREICASCHGARWEGGRAPSMLDDVWAHGGDDESLARSIRQGYVENAMPAFGTLLDAQQIRAMVVYIRECRERARQQPKRPPARIDGLEFDSEQQRFRLERVADGLETPWGMAFLPDGRLLVTERPGRIRMVEIGRGIVGSIRGVPEVWLRQDGGLFDLALHPDFARNGWLYLSFSEEGKLRGTSATRIIRARLRDGRLVEPQDIFRARPEQFWEGNSHYGSRLRFDRAGFLYFTIGDRGHRDDAQDLASPYGKLHRVRDDGSAPADNPFAHRPGAVASIWSYGHRNQQGIAQHPVTGELWTAEHGPRGGDELNVIAAGKNYGWPVITYGMNDDGTPITDLTAKEGMEQPVKYWTPSIAVCALEFYTGDKFPRWKNQLFATALGGKRLLRLELDGHRVVHEEILFRDLARVRDVVAGPDGFLYVALNREFDDSPGEIVRLVPVAPGTTD